MCVDQIVDLFKSDRFNLIRLANLPVVTVFVASISALINHQVFSSAINRKNGGITGIGRLVGALAIAMSVLFSQAALSAGMKSALKYDSQAPNFTLKSILGENVRLSELRGQVILVNFWASWCAPCRQEMPALEKLYQEYQSLGFTVLGVNVDNDQEKGIAAAAGANISFPILFDTNKTVSEQFDVQAMPTSVIVDRDGKVKYVHFGYKAGDENLYAEKVKAAIKGTL